MSENLLPINWDRLSSSEFSCSRSGYVLTAILFSASFSINMWTSTSFFSFFKIVGTSESSSREDISLFTCSATILSEVFVLSSSINAIFSNAVAILSNSIFESCIIIHYWALLKISLFQITAADAKSHFHRQPKPRRGPLPPRRTQK